MSLSELNALDLAKTPQDPFCPQVTPDGPAFLDDAACLCALQISPDTQASNLVWQCIGNQTTDVYSTVDGKWFSGLSGGNDTNLPIDDASNLPDKQHPLMYDGTNGTLAPYSASAAVNMTVYNKACTANNQTVFSTAFYRAVDEQQKNQTMVDAAPCYREGGVPMQIQNVSSWQSQGCNLGFLCANNTVNSLPQFCPPLTVCQEARLTGSTCKFEGKNIGMGPFEPVVCQQGFYCPPGGKEIIPCPAGSYCQPGAPSPTPCPVGSRCPEGSVKAASLIPLAVLILVDILLMVAMFFHHLRSRVKRAAKSRLNVLKNPGSVKNEMTGYRALPNDQEQDHEMMQLHNVPSYYGPSYTNNVWNGFQDAIGLAAEQGTHVTNMGKQLSPQLQAFIDSMRRATDASHFGLSFSFDNLSFHPKKVPKPILQNVTGSIQRGSLVAVMGGSGAGKSTFVNVLMGKTTNTSGTVMVNNVPGKIAKYKKLIGYVPQDDIVLPELTVCENILHSARIRLPRTWSDVDIKAHVNACIDCLELSHVRDSLVGSVGKPTISGGQRKRVSIGMELAAAPMCIFLDEPTSGLDATSASSLMESLKALARLGISVVVIIHQPRMEIFEILDDLILLGNGQMIYQGSEAQARAFFEGQGFHFPPHANYADVITDIITGNGREYKRDGDISKEALIQYWQKATASGTEYNGGYGVPKAEIVVSIDERDALHTALKRRGARRHVQVWLCLRRAMLQQYRLKTTFWFEMGLSALAGFLLGLAENGKQGIMFTGLYNAPLDVLSLSTDFKSVPELALLTCIAIGLVAGAPGVKIFSEEMLLHRREAEAGHSRLAYFLAKIVSAFPRMIVGCLHFTALLLLLATPVISTFLAFLANMLYFYCIYGLAAFISMIAKREDAPLFATMISLIVGILSGAAPPLAKVKQWGVEWLWRASPGVWLAEIYFGQIVEPARYLYNVDMASQATGFHLNWLWRNMLILLGIGTIYRLLAFVGLFAGQRLRL